jgi:hypothetical protein
MRGQDMAQTTAFTEPPSWIPSGFKMRRRESGLSKAGFSDRSDHVSYVYTRGTRNEDWASPLSFHWTGEPTALDATENREGVRVDLGGGRMGIYHDGLWGPPLDVESGPVWFSGTAHSLTLEIAGETWAVRGPRDNLTLMDLTKTLLAWLP